MPEGGVTSVFLIIKLLFPSLSLCYMYQACDIRLLFQNQKVLRVLEKMHGILKAMAGTALSTAHGHAW